jgi:hypothetical protein
VLGDNAYEVVDGFLAEPEQRDAAPPLTNERVLKLFAAS